MKTPGPDHPINISPTAGQVTVRVDGTVVASSDAALSLVETDYPVIQYVPLRDVESDLLQASDTVTTCPYKGDATYYDLVIGNTTHRDVVWRYANPQKGVAQIGDAVAFDPSVAEVEIS